MTRIGILGGTFNPIHFGHLRLAEAARESFGLAKVLFIPSGQAHEKDPSLIPSGEERLRLCALATANHPSFAVSDMEIGQKGSTYTCDTLQALQEQWPDAQLFFLAGSDTFLTMRNWLGPERIFALASILVAIRRDGTEPELIEEKAACEREYNARIQFLPMPRLDISSTQIRSLVAKGLSIRYLVPETVREYILERGLYLNLEP